MFILNLNPMTANAERSVPVARAETKEALVAFVENERVEPYTDGQWHKCFRKGGPLEWFNPPYGTDAFFVEFEDVGTLEDWLRSTQRRWETFLQNVSAV